MRYHSGPFSIRIPIVTDRARHAWSCEPSGRERIISQPYYATPRLLQMGLHDYSYELGFARRNFGLESSDYGRFLAVGRIDWVSVIGLPARLMVSCSSGKRLSALGARTFGRAPVYFPHRSRRAITARVAVLYSVPVSSGKVALSASVRIRKLRANALRRSVCSPANSRPSK